jgi:hypothetical protein
MILKEKWIEMLKIINKNRKIKNFIGISVIIFSILCMVSFFMGVYHSVHPIYTFLF